MARFFAQAGLMALGLHVVAAISRAANSGEVLIIDETPNLPFDPNTIATCSWWWDNDGSTSCKNMPDEWGISMANFLSWNPSITADCGHFLTGRSYCVEAPSTGPDPTSTSTGNGVATPTPTQDGMVNDCNKFYFVETNDNCDVISRDNGISRAQFVSYNPSVGDTCSGMWANVYVCVGVIGGSSPTTTQKQTTTTTGGNGITTPTPIQDGMVSNCDAFYFVERGDNCDTIARNHGISRAQLVSYNPLIGDTCTGMWANVYLCVSLIGTSPTTSPKPTTTKGNGIATPTPIQDGMVKNCNRFHFVASANTCQSIATRYSITVAQFTRWNPAVGNSCTNLWSSTYACVGVVS